MKLAAAIDINKIEMTPEMEEMSRPLMMSGAFHFMLVLLAIIGLPHAKPELPDFNNAIAVEIVQIDEKTETTKPVEKREAAESVPKPKPEQVRKKPPPPPTVKAEKPPRPVKPKPPELSEVAPEAEAKPAEKKPEPVQKKEEEQDEEFKALLKNLEEHEPEQANKTKGPLLTGSQPDKYIPLGDRMTMNEQQAVLQRLGECWNIMAGARYAEQLVVRVVIAMNPDRTIRNARVEDQARYMYDSYFRAAGDSALRALGHPHCRVLPLPVDKYDQWKEFTVTFDPREMLQ